MHAFALPGLSQTSCENDTSTPGFIILRRWWLQLSEHNVGCFVGEGWGCGGCMLFSLLLSLTPTLGDRTHIHPPEG